MILKFCSIRKKHKTAFMFSLGILAFLILFSIVIIFISFINFEIFKNVAAVLWAYGLRLAFLWDINSTKWCNGFYTELLKKLFPTMNI